MRSNTSPPSIRPTYVHTRHGGIPPSSALGTWCSSHPAARCVVSLVVSLVVSCTGEFS
jgi:hypothetical protein